MHLNKKHKYPTNMRVVDPQSWVWMIWRSDNILPQLGLEPQFTGYQAGILLVNCVLLVVNCVFIVVGCVVLLLIVFFLLLIMLLLLLIVLFYVLFACKCVLYYCHQVSTQLQLTHHIISYHIYLKSGISQIKGGRFTARSNLYSVGMFTK